jgi:hypothetical protein
MLKKIKSVKILYAKWFSSFEANIFPISDLMVIIVMEHLAQNVELFLLLLQLQTVLWYFF